MIPSIDSKVIGSCSRKSPIPTRKVAADLIVQIRKREGVQMRCYHCAHCGLWHLTSRPK